MPSPVPAKRRVLVIEDNEDSADSLKELLALDGHDVRVAYDGPSGIALAHDFRPEVVVCDIGLPGMNGYEVARAIRASGTLRGCHLIALSGYARHEDRRAAAAAGFREHLAKPVRPEALARVMATAPRETSP
jgi:two-component system CheB/CheR fusion protein